MLTSRRLLPALFATIAALSASTASGQTMTSQQGLNSLGSDANLGLAYLPVKSQPSQEGGVRLSESSVLHVGLGAEAGYDSNVFFNNAGKLSSPVLRLVPFAELTNAGRAGEVPSGVFYSLSASLLYREYLSSEDRIKAQRAFNPTVNGLVEFSRGQSLSLSIGDTFIRFEDPPYAAPLAGTTPDNIIRLYNLGYAQLRWSPGGGRIAGVVRYANNLDYFETESLKYANNMGHEGMLDVSWRWLPKTALFVQYAQGYISYLNSQTGAASPRINSAPLRATAGLRGLITEKLSMSLAGGYQNGFYSSGPSPSGFAAVAELTFVPTLLTQLTLGYRHDFRNSPVLFSFYNVDSVYLSLRSLVASRVAFGGFGKYENRRYNAMGPDSRIDNVVQAGAGADVYVQRWFYAGVSYVATFSRTSGFSAGKVDYDKHLLLGRLGVTY